MVLYQSNAVESPSLNCLANPLYCSLADHSVSKKTAIKCKMKPEWSRTYEHTGNENCKSVETGIKSTTYHSNDSGYVFLFVKYVS